MEIGEKDSNTNVINPKVLSHAFFAKKYPVKASNDIELTEINFEANSGEVNGVKRVNNEDKIG